MKGKNKQPTIKDYESFVQEARDGQILFDLKSINFLVVTVSQYRGEGELSLNMCSETFDVVIDKMKDKTTEITDNSCLVYGCFRINKKDSFVEQMKKNIPFEKWVKEVDLIDKKKESENKLLKPNKN